MLCTLLLRGQMYDNRLLSNTEIDSEFLIVSSNLYQSFRVEGKKRIHETVCTTVKSWHTVYPCCSSLLNFWNQID